MGDVSAEPSMEEILSSIKRIIAEEGEGGRSPARRPQRPPVQMTPPRPAPPPPQPSYHPDAEEVLELSEPIPAPIRAPEPAPPERIVQERPAPERVPHPAPERMAQPAPTVAAAAAAPVQTPPADPIVSQHAADASRGSLDTLSRLVVRPEGTPVAGSPADAVLEGMIREMLRPMLSEWLDARLPEIVEAMVAREIERITGSR